MRALLLAQTVAVFAVATAVAYPSASSYNGRIIDGELAGQALPYVVSIQSEDNSHLCGGFIYNELWVITVASCVAKRESSSLKISINDYKFINLNEPGERKVTVYKIVVNEAYNETTRENDIALLELSQKLELTPISENEPPTNASCVKYDEVPYIGVDGSVPGWGWLTDDGLETATLHNGYVQVVSSDDCEVYGSLFSTPIMICASSQPSPSAASNSSVTVPCRGDEGSPLIVESPENGEEPIVVGLYSINVNCSADYPSVFTRLSMYYSWIGNTAGPQPSNCFE